MSKIVLITGCAPEHCFVANTLASAFPIDAILIDAGAPVSRKKRIQKLRRHTPAQFVSRALLKLWMRLLKDEEKRQADIVSVLGQESLGHRFETRTVPGINSQHSIETLRNLAPDILLLYGVSIAGREVLRSAKVTLNLHTGIAPQYRGTNCAFWPIYNGEPERIGATVHLCTEHVDGGAILAQERAPLKREDNSIHKVFARAVATGAALYPKAIEAFQHGYRGEPQDLSSGREYRAVMWGVGQEWLVRRRIQNGLQSA